MTEILMNVGGLKPQKYALNTINTRVLVISVKKSYQHSEMKNVDNYCESEVYTFSFRQ
jgi:hypothetical protein